MHSLALYLSVLTGPQRPVNSRLLQTLQAVVADRAAAMLFSTGLSQVVVTEVLLQTEESALRSLCIHYFEQKTAKQVAIFRL
jgi:hypothetical protein